MDFFAYQREAKRKSRWLIFGVLLATLVIIAAVDVIVLVFLAWQGLASGSVVHYTGTLPSIFDGILSPAFLRENASILLASSAGVAGLIGIASFGKVASLRAGGGKVARQLGGDLITADNRDPLRRRLYNVVEEMSIASGVPVPEVYVLEQESGINAFAAGYSQSDAAVAVTRGALEKLNRAELQGVIAHEFSHILNGDMRINIRMMGVMFGILVLAIIGRSMLSSNRYTRVRRNNKGTSVTILVGLALTVIGYIGLFAARWMKAMLSRQREYLADASAVQFTREPSGLADALKKIASHHHGSYLNAETEEISHMLFGDGERPSYFSSKLFATHPPLLDRIRRIEPRFNERELSRFAKRMHELEQREHVQADMAEREEEPAIDRQSRQAFDPAQVLSDIGNPQLEQILAAALLAQSFPKPLEQAAHSIEWSPEVMLFALLDDDISIRDQQLLIIHRHMGDISERKLQHIISSCNKLEIEQRLPLLEMTFPQVKRRPIEEQEKLLATVREVIVADGRIDPFEYLLAKMIELHIEDASRPDKVIIVGDLTLSECADEVASVIGLLALQGHEDKTIAARSYANSLNSLNIKGRSMPSQSDWTARVDAALPRLNQLRAEDKKQLVMALAETVMHDGKLTVPEHELLRAICAGLHVPLPLLT